MVDKQNRVRETTQVMYQVEKLVQRSKDTYQDNVVSMYEVVERDLTLEQAKEKVRGKKDLRIVDSRTGKEVN